MRLQLEIAANSLASALAAQDGGADRVELCENLGEGGCTPSYGTLALAREHLHIPLYVLIRPRAGDFLYDTLEAELMLRDIGLCRQLGCDGVVIGALDADSEVDLPLCRELISAAAGMGVTFHRAFDVARDPVKSLDAILTLGCERVLTSGGADSAAQGTETIRRMVLQSAGRLAVMAGAGVCAGNVAALVNATGVREVHASAKSTRPSAMRQRERMPAGLAVDWLQSDVRLVRHLRETLDGMAS